MNSVPLTRRDATVRRIIAATFPTYNGRKLRLVAQDTVELDGNFWSEGSRKEYRFVKLDDFTTATLPTQNPLRDADTKTTVLPEGFACVRHTVNCGIDCGLTIIVNPANVAPLLAAGATR